jgi:hypothetical protein
MATKTYTTEQMDDRTDRSRHQWTVDGDVLCREETVLGTGQAHR